ncbi:MULTISPECIES: PEP-CTERM sorting domain-containing protein [unclassified Nostoc]|uniref:PEP-CTERM sorting domain-containing protein n=1 Tax=unclassified Nostoc TaxID=2593658 RepID=UPI0026388022|nr:PEP-CTERM sorting domain-containing protein [Nostoc sp. S13]MDF5734784.1 PEP-CTERM sorting domain-containing protein [Nostoc sp. S13]
MFGAASGTGLIDFGTLTVKSSGTVNIIGGEGIFRGATGTLAFSQIQPLSLQVGVALKGQFTVNGSFQTVPEPKTVTALIGVGAMGVYLLMRRHRQRATSV